MFFFVGWTTRPIDQETGYMHCPACRTRKPAVEGIIKTHLTVFFIPLIPISTGRSYYRCEGCQGMFNTMDDFPFDFGENLKPKLWECRFCHSTHPPHVLRCKVCGADA